MTNYNSQEKIDQRANQIDPIIMYLVVRESLNMSAGKACAQCAHASQMLLIKYFDMKYNANIENLNKIRLFDDWLNTSFRKVVLVAKENQWNKLKEELSKNDYIIVTDNGLTEVAPQTDTVIGILPIIKSTCPKIIKKLQTLK